MKLAIHFFNEKKTSINWLNRNVGQLLRHAVVWRSDHRLNHKSNLFSCCFDCLWHNNNTLSRLTPNTYKQGGSGWLLVLPWERKTIVCLFCRFSTSAFARRGNYGGIKPDKRNRLKMNPIPILFITNVTIHMLTHTMLYLETEYGKNGVKIQYFPSRAFYPQFLPSFLQLSAFFSRTTLQLYRATPGD